MTADDEPTDIISDTWVSGFFYNASDGKYHSQRPKWWGTRHIVDHSHKPAHSHSHSHSYSGFSGYTPPPKPWVGVDRNRFPATWNCLVMFYYSGDWYQMTTTSYKSDYPKLKEPDNYYGV